VKPGRVLFELGGINRATAAEAMKLAAHKLAIKTRFVTRIDYQGV
jgi:large subunit ribosomal protein L16